MTPFGRDPLFRLEVMVRAPVPVDAPPGGSAVRMVSITGGAVSGALTGLILPGGTDWQTVRGDGVIDINARYILELEGGAGVELQARGLRTAGADSFWQSIWLSSGDPAYLWVNQCQFIGLGRKVDGSVMIDVYALPDDLT